jgi:hypothetical protein
MRMHQIEIDDEVFTYLKVRAEPFVDTPNAVLRRELLDGRPGRKLQTPSQSNGEDATSAELLAGAPHALQQIVEVTILVVKGGKDRAEATSLVARRLGVAQQTVLDKYCRQLGLSASQFDKLLAESGLIKLRGLLTAKFPRWSAVIDEALQ